MPILAVFIAFALYFYLTRWRAKKLLGSPFPVAWQEIITKRLPVYFSLSPQEQARLQQLIKQFIADKRFYGCGGLVITDEMRVTIAAEACLLLLNRGGAIYPDLSSVLVYPTGFIVEREQHQPDGTVASAEHSLLGESWSNGKVILSWDDVEKGAADFTDGHNVVLHEFAHQLDAESGSTNGAPPLRRNSYKAWATIFAENFEELAASSMLGHHTLLDQYGATNPAEFFAVATETFFEMPHQLHDRHPDLYGELANYYRIDPRAWHRPEL
ncbi:MAG: M90 family metallopeptidase [Halieaceae bacterium]|nr:M90 family metallopeptidase [Halieaceae bacterium]